MAYEVRLGCLELWLSSFSIFFHMMRSVAHATSKIRVTPHFFFFLFFHFLSVL